MRRSQNLDERLSAPGEAESFLVALEVAPRGSESGEAHEGKRNTEGIQPPRAGDEESDEPDEGSGISECDAEKEPRPIAGEKRPGVRAIERALDKPRDDQADHPEAGNTNPCDVR